MKHNKFLKAIFIITLPSLLFSYCKKNDNKCEVVSTNGRIIGYNPCRYYTPINDMLNPGFVIEIDNTTSKDTVIIYAIPTDLFQFPNIDESSAINGQFLYEPVLQDKFKIKFTYRFVPDNEKTAVVCRGNIYTAPFDAVIRGKEVSITCISKQ